MQMTCEVQIEMFDDVQTETLGRPNPIRLCVTCRSKDLAERREFMLRHFVCNDCGTRLEQIGQKFRLDQDSHPRPKDPKQKFSQQSRTWAKQGNGSLSDIEVWQKYAGQTLSSGEWANIANGGLSDGEIANRAKQRTAAVLQDPQAARRAVSLGPATASVGAAAAVASQ